MKYIKIRREEEEYGDLSNINVDYAEVYEENSLSERTKLGEIALGPAGQMVFSQFYTEDCFLLMNRSGSLWAFNIKTKEQLYHKKVVGSFFRGNAILSEDKKILYVFSNEENPHTSKHDQHIHYLSLEDFSIVRSIKIPITKRGFHHFEKYKNHFLFYYNGFKKYGEGKKYYHHYDLIDIETGVHTQKKMPHPPLVGSKYFNPIMDFVNGKGIMPHYGELEREGEKIYLKIMIFDLDSFEVERIIPVRLYKLADFKISNYSRFTEFLLGSPESFSHQRAFREFTGMIKLIMVDEQRACVWLQFQKPKSSEIKYRRVGYDSTMSVLYNVTIPKFEKEGFATKKHITNIHAIKEGRLLIHGDFINKEYGLQMYHLPFKEEKMVMKKEMDLEKTQTILLKEINPLKTIDKSHLNETPSTKVVEETVPLKTVENSNTNKTPKRKLHIGGIPLEHCSYIKEESLIDILGISRSDNSHYKEFTNRKEFLEHFYKEHEKFDRGNEFLIGYYYYQEELYNEEEEEHENITWLMIISPDIFQTQILRKLTKEWAEFHSYTADASIVIIDEEKSEVALATTRFYKDDYELVEHSIYYNGKKYEEHQPLVPPMGNPNFKVKDWENFEINKYIEMPIYCEKPGAVTYNPETFVLNENDHEVFYINNFYRKSLYTRFLGK